MKSNKLNQEFGKKYIHDGCFVFSINHEKQGSRIDFVHLTQSLAKHVEELRADNFLMLSTNPGCSLLLDTLVEKVTVLAERNIISCSDLYGDSCGDSDFIYNIYLQAFEIACEEMIEEEIYFPVPELKDIRIKYCF